MDGRAVLFQALSQSIRAIPPGADRARLTSVLNYMADRSADLPAWDMLPWQPFREGLEIAPLSPAEQIDGATALLRYQAGASVPHHLHVGNEHVFVLHGGQQDEQGHYPAGTFLINTAGSTHSVASPEGCIVAIMWEKPIVFP